jgi:hypothetical protein
METNDHDILVKILTKVDRIEETLKQLPILEERVRDLEKSDGIKDEQISTVKDEIGKLRNQNVGFSLLNTILIFIAGYLGVTIK